MKRKLVLDIELYQNYLLVMFKSLDNGVVRYFEMHDDQPLDRDTVMAVLRDFTVITFNGLDYDLPMLFLAFTGATLPELKAASNHIIEGGLRGWQFEQQYGIKVPKWVDHIDLREPVPGVQISLKLYGARLHSKRLQDLPIEHTALITPEQRETLRRYCENDLDTTIDLWNKATDPKDDIIATREIMSAEFGIDFRSKSDAQIAEAAIKARVSQALGQPVYRPEITPGTTYRYQAPAWLRFDTPALQAKFAEILSANFVVKADGKVDMPACLDGAEVTLGDSVYRMGVGGLHSSEKFAGHVALPGMLIRDTDVVSYYPSLILLCGLFPKNMGEHFQRVYREFFVRRVSAKKAGHKSTAQTLKIVLNGTFGKLGSKWSVLYSPNLLIQVTVTGQLALLMLIERMEAAGIRVISANTDGVVQLLPEHLEPVRQAIVRQWERDTGLETEDTQYRGLFSRDVNNYVALKAGGGVKTKGVFAEAGVQKNPDHPILSRAVCDLLDKGTPIAQTIVSCRDIRQFLTVQRVTGGAQVPTSGTWLDNWSWNKTDGQWEQWHGQRRLREKRKSRPKPVYVTSQAQYLGKVVRWYRSTRGYSQIEYVKNGNKVGGSDKAMPLMDLPDTFPDDVDHAWYIAEADKMLREIGAYTTPN